VTDVEGRLAALLAHSPGLSAREIASLLRREGVAVHKRDLNPLLYAGSQFENDQGRVPRWRLRGALSNSPFTRDDRAAARRSQRQSYDRRQETVAALRGGFADGSETDDAVRQAVALLRSRGFSVDDGTRPPQPPIDAMSPPDAGVAPSRAHRDPLPVPVWSLPLRSWQQQALTNWYDAGGVGVCEAVTGTGKTHLGLEAVAQWIRRGERATVVVPSVLLQRQWEQRMAQFVPEAVIAKAGGDARGDAARADVVIAVVNTAAARDLTELGGDMTLLVADEAHRYGGEGWGTALRPSYPYRLALTATLERGSDEGVAQVLLPYFERVVHSYGFAEATREKVVAPFDLIFLGVALDDEDQVTYDSLGRKISQARKILLKAGGDRQKLHQQLNRLRSMGGQVANAVRVYENATRDRRRLLADTPAKQEALGALAGVVGESRTVLFTQSTNAAIAAAEMLAASGLRAAAVYSDGMPPARRQELIDGLDDGTLDALAAPRILDEGVDIADIALGIVMGASSSRRQMIQRLGRVIRLKPDSRRARFVVLYVHDSIEDPDTGARDDFMEEVEDAANNVMLFRDWDENTIDDAWSGHAALWHRAPKPVPTGASRLSVSPPTSIKQPGDRPEAAPPAERTAEPVSSSAPARRVSRPLPPARRPDYPDPLFMADLLQRIDESRALAAWIRAELAPTGSE
jgi:superfamily II DNA or RNA helicase